MNTQDEISELLAEWLQLTEAESEAIQAGDWVDLENNQLAKLNLQSRITRAMANDGEKSSIEQNSARFQMDFKRLLALELRNSELLARQIENAGQAKNSLNQSARNLRRIHHTYTQKPEIAWQSYS